MLAPVRARRRDRRRARRRAALPRSSADAPTTSWRATQLAEQLAERGILYAPDFIVNAAGLINVARADRVRRRRGAARAADSRRCSARVLAQAAAAGTTPLAAAVELASDRIAAKAAEGDCRRAAA